MPAQSRLPWLVPDACVEKKLSFIIDYSRLTQAVVSHRGQLFPVTNAEANEMMRRRIFVIKYQVGDTLHLDNTEPEFVRPTTAPVTTQAPSTE